MINTNHEKEDKEKENKAIELLMQRCINKYISDESVSDFVPEYSKVFVDTVWEKIKTNNQEYFYFYKIRHLTQLQIEICNLITLNTKMKSKTNINFRN
jgi:uncharacterized protein (TIGR01589 family)